MNEDEFIPIVDAARAAKACLVRKGDTVAAAYWTGDMWAYNIPTGVHQLDFEPTHYAPRRPHA